jgi:hypothetical protein
VCCDFFLFRFIESNKWKIEKQNERKKEKKINFGKTQTKLKTNNNILTLQASWKRKCLKNKMLIIKLKLNIKF